MLSNWGCSSSTGEDFTILSDALTAVVLPGNTFSVDSLLLPFLLMNSLFCLLAYISLRISWEIALQERFATAIRDKVASGNYLVGTVTFPHTGPDASLTFVQVLLAKNRTYGPPPVEKKVRP
jgi:hypothetical protein